MISSHPTPVVLFAYARPDMLRMTLNYLKAEGVPLILAYSDAPKSEADQKGVDEVRAMLHEVDWCEIHICERLQNMGLGQSILNGVTEVFERYGKAIVLEDDLTCVPGTYAYLSAALDHYRDDERVMSVTGWTHPDVTPDGVKSSPYFDGRSECLAWGTWRRGWDGMDLDAVTLLRQLGQAGKDIFEYGNDIPEMAISEKRRNIWAVRFLLLHMVRGGLVMRPPWNLVTHWGVGQAATNCTGATRWDSHAPAERSPHIPENWPEPVEHPECSALWRAAYSPTGRLQRIRFHTISRFREWFLNTFLDKQP